MEAMLGVTFLFSPTEGSYRIMLVDWFPDTLITLWLGTERVKARQQNKGYKLTRKQR